MRRIELAVDHGGAVEMDGGAVRVALPLGDQRAGLLVVFGDDRVVDRVERGRIDADALARFLDLEALDQFGRADRRPQFLGERRQRGEEHSNKSKRTNVHHRSISVRAHPPVSGTTRSSR
jgi:hypothetical protein